VGGGGEERTSELKTMEPDRSVLNKGVKKDGLETKHTMSMEEWTMTATVYPK
jgi:hypothetical protein